MEVVPEVPLGEQLRKHVREYLTTKESARRASAFGDDIGQAEAQLEQRLRRFEHELGRLAATPGESAGPPQAELPEEPEDRPGELPSTAAAGLAAMLSNPQSLRQAIVINEVLTRPEQRWS